MGTEPVPQVDDVIREITGLVNEWMADRPTGYPTTVYLPLAYAQAVAPYALGPDAEGRDPFDGRILGMDMERMEDGPPRVE